MIISKKESIYISELQKKIKENPNFKFTLEDQYHWFLLRKHFGFIKGGVFNELYKSNEFDEFYQHKENHYKEYKYIYNRLSTKKSKIEFRNDYLDQLEALKSKYTQNKFVEVLNNAINEINDFHLQNNKDIPKTTQEDEKNPYPNIFTTDGFSLFKKLHDQYKNEPNKVANYSFVFYAMDIDKKIHCTGMKFVEFLGALNVKIDRIDARQSGNDNKKYKFYNAIKAQ